jgi:hypothetical protein
MRGCTIAQDTVEARLRTQAIRTAAILIKQRARVYAKHPAALEAVCPGFPRPGLKNLPSWRDSISQGKENCPAVGLEQEARSHW